MKIWIEQALLEHLDSWSKFTLTPIVVESYYLSNFIFLNEEIDHKIGIYAKNWARQVLKNVNFWLRFMQESTFWKLDVCKIFEFQMKKRISKSECTWKIEWDRYILKILTFGQDSCKSQLFRNWAVCTISESWMKKWIPKLKCTQKTEWDRSILKILTFGQDSCKSQIFRNWAVCTISESWIKKRIPKLECTWKTEWDRPILEILTFWSNSKFNLVKPFSFFFFFFRWFRPGQDERVKQGRPGQTDLTIVGGDVTHDVMACVNAWETVDACSLRQKFPNIIKARGCACLCFWAWNFKVLYT